MKVVIDVYCREYVSIVIHSLLIGNYPTHLASVPNLS